MTKLRKQFENEAKDFSRGKSKTGCDTRLDKNIADNLRQIRAKKRISQDKLADMCEISQQYICKIENEKVNPSIYVLFKIASAMGITVNDLIY